MTFDNERTKYRHQIKDLQDQLIKKECAMSIANDYISVLENKNKELKDEIKRLRDLIDMSREDLDLLVNKHKRLDFLKSSLNSAFGAVYFNDPYINPTREVPLIPMPRHIGRSESEERFWNEYLGKWNFPLASDDEIQKVEKPKTNMEVVYDEFWNPNV